MSDDTSEELKGPDLSTGIPAEQLTEANSVLGHANGEQVLLVRHDGDIFAVGPQCTHYGGPLAEGIVACGTVRCPWHHAHFSLSNGIATAPGLDPIPTYTVVQENGNIIVGEQVEQRPSSASASSPNSVVIIGGGAAGAACTEKLRELGYEGTLTFVVGSEPWPVDRPNLSKDFLAGDAPAEWLPVREPSFYEDINVEFVQGRATSIEPDQKLVVLDSGRPLSYDTLILATGASARDLPVTGSDKSHVFTLRTLQDAKAISNAATHASQAVVIGASFIGLEVAASLTQRDVNVTIAAPEAVPLANIMGEDVGKFIQHIHESNGVSFQLGASLKGIRDDTVELDDGTMLPADLVVLGVGVAPQTELAKQAGLTVDDGVVVDGQFRTSDTSIYAIGDIAKFPYRNSNVRIEHWAVAGRQGHAVAHHLMGKPASTTIPFFWSQHFDISISYVGHAADWETIEIDGSLDEQDAAIVYRKDNEILAVATIGRDKTSLKTELAMESGDVDMLESLFSAD